MDNKLKQWYDLLPGQRQREVKKQIIVDCDISEKTFYNWLNQTTEVSFPAKLVISGIAGKKVKKLFPALKTTTA